MKLLQSFFFNLRHLTLFCFNFQVRGKEMEMKKLQSRVSELEDEIRQNQFLIQQAEKQISNLKRLKEDKNLELTQVNILITVWMS